MAALSPSVAALLGLENVANAGPLPFPPGTELDIAILNFALNLEYLEGEYYNLGANGKSLSDLGITLSGGGTQGTVKVKDNPQVPFKTAALQQYAAEIANDEANHVQYIQSVITSLGGTPVAEPSINLVDSFNAISNMAGLGATFDPFADETSFYLGGFSLTDVGVTAYHGGAPHLTNKSVILGAGGLLAVEAYHAATLRLTIFQAGSDAQSKAGAISDLRDLLDDGGKKDDDQGVVNSDGSPNLVPTDEHSIVFARTPNKVLNIVCGGQGVRAGGFYPNGVNGPIH